MADLVLWIKRGRRKCPKRPHSWFWEEILESKHVCSAISSAFSALEPPPPPYWWEMSIRLFKEENIKTVLSPGVPTDRIASLFAPDSRLPDVQQPCPVRWTVVRTRKNTFSCCMWVIRGKRCDRGDYKQRRQETKEEQLAQQSDDTCATTRWRPWTKSFVWNRKLESRLPLESKNDVQNESNSNLRFAGRLLGVLACPGCAQAKSAWI